MLYSQCREKKVVQCEVQKSSFNRCYDVIVVGMGTAGAIATISAARKGLKVLGVERQTCMGGTGTAGAVLGYYFGSRGGLYEEIDAGIAPLEEKVYTPVGGVNGEAKKYLLEQAALESGVSILYEAAVIGVYLEGSKVVGIRWIGPDGLEEAGSKMVIDCTGDAEVCFLAGCETRLGRGIDRQTQPFSSVRVILKDGKVRYAYDDCGYVDQTDGWALSAAIIRSNALHLKERFDEESRLLYVAPLLGIREGRLIAGEEDVTLAGYLQDQMTDRPAFYAYSNIDNHGKDIAFESEAQQDWAVVGSLWGLNISVPIPMGAMIPKGYDGILAAGRCIAVDHDIAACVRQKRCMQKSGEAAAMTAYLAIQKKVPAREVPYCELLPLLKETHCFDERNNVKMKDIVSNVDDLNKVVQWLTRTEEIEEALGSEKPGIAIFSAWRLGDRIRQHLKDWVMQKENEHLRKHSAFALALLGDREALPVLREMVRQRDGYVPKTSRKYNQVRGYTAIYLLGRLRDDGAVPELLDILDNPSGIAKPSVESRKKGEFIEFSDATEFIANEQEYCFQYFSHALMALMKIGEAYPGLRSRIAEALSQATGRENFSQTVTLKGPSRYEHSMTEKIREVVTKQLEQWQDR